MYVSHSVYAVYNMTLGLISHQQNQIFILKTQAFTLCTTKSYNEINKWNEMEWNEMK